MNDYFIEVDRTKTKYLFVVHAKKHVACLPDLYVLLRTYSENPDGLDKMPGDFQVLVKVFDTQYI